MQNLWVFFLLQTLLTLTSHMKSALARYFDDDGVRQAIDRIQQHVGNIIAYDFGGLVSSQYPKREWFAAKPCVGRIWPFVEQCSF